MHVPPSCRWSHDRQSKTSRRYLSHRDTPLYWACSSRWPARRPFIYLDSIWPRRSCADGTTVAPTRAKLTNMDLDDSSPRRGSHIRCGCFHFSLKQIQAHTARSSAYRSGALHGIVLRRKWASVQLMSRALQHMFHRFPQVMASLPLQGKAPTVDLRLPSSPTTFIGR